MKLRDLLFIDITKQYAWLLKFNDLASVTRTAVFIAGISIAWLVGYKWRDGKIWFQERHIRSLYQEQGDLQRSVSELEGNLKDYNFMISDGDYYRYLAFKHADIAIPKDVNPQHLRLMTEEAYRNGIPLNYYYRLINKESRYNPDALSSKGASGYMQIMPPTFKLMSDRYRGRHRLDRLDSDEKNIVVGSFMLGYLYKKYKRWDLTFAAYNAGSVVSECNCVPNFSETKEYVRYIINKN